MGVVNVSSVRFVGVGTSWFENCTHLIRGSILYAIEVLRGEGGGRRRYENCKKSLVI